MWIELDDKLALCGSRKLCSMLSANGGTIDPPLQNDIHVV